jgi:Spy/CpxP family protein refolding chaperone
MRHVTFGMTLTLGVMFVLSMAIPVQSGMMGHGQMGKPEGAPESSPGGMMGQGGQGSMGMMNPQMQQQMMRGIMGGGMQGVLGGMAMARPSQLVRMLKTELELSDEQAKRLTQIVSQATKATIRQHADLRIAELELRELLEADQVDLAQVEGKLKAVEGLRTQLRLSLIKAHEQAKSLLTPEQRHKLEPLHDQLLGILSSGMMGTMEMTGHGGGGAMGGMGMMGAQKKQPMMQGMMGGGAGEQPKSPMQMAGSPQKLTQEDTQGAVTVIATLLTLDKPRADGKLAVRLKLDTHAVDLAQYQVDRHAVLRDSQGQEIQAAGFESNSGDAHHREGVLTFPGMRASGKPLLNPEVKSITLILRGLGGIEERVFRWELPAGARM